MNVPDLRDALLTLNDDQLTSLASSLGIDYESLHGIGHFGRTRELVEQARQKRKLEQLGVLVEQLHGGGPVPATVAAVGTSAAGDLGPAHIPVQINDSPAAPPETTNSRSPAITQRVARLFLIPLIAILLIGTLVLLAARRQVQAAPTATVEPSARAISTIPPVPTSRLVILVSSTPLPVTETPAPATSTAVVTFPAANVSVISTGVISVATPSVSIRPTLSPTVTPTQTPGPPTQTATPQATATAFQTPVATATQVSPDSTAAVNFVSEINLQVMAYLLGKVTVADLEANWQGSALVGVQDFLNTKVPASLAVGGVDKRTIQSSMRYLGTPVVTTDANGATVTSREAWKYSSKVSGKSVCETRDYLYKLIKSGDRLKVDEFTGKLVDVKCTTE